VSSITYFLRDNGACGYYRIDLPLQTIKKKSDTIVKCIQKGDSASHIESCFDSDIFIIPRVAEPEMVDVMKRMKLGGKKIVVDFDDDLFNVSPFSPHYVDFGIESINVNYNGGNLPLWEDGKNINITVNKEKMETIKKAVSVADMVTVSTEILANVYRQYNNNVRILPNCVDTNLWQKLPLKSDHTIKLYWSGGSSHYQDWLILKDVLPVIMEKHKDIKLVLMGTKFDGTIKNIPKDRIEYHTWVPTPAYPYKSTILNPDISIIPLEDTVFNRSKSAIKWIEMGALAVPSVCSFVSPYKEVYNGTNGVFIENNSVDGWVKGISTLIEDPILRAKLGGAAQDSVKRNFDINTQYHQWIDVYQELLNGN
jgi:glycosyltransferase involved in cell wall biosynthesis